MVKTIILKDQDNILLPYKEAKNQIGIYLCNGKEIDNDTTIVYEMFHEDIVKTGSLAKDHNVVTLWLCTVNVFCKCGEYHHITSAVPAKYQILEILENIENQEDITFSFPDKEPDGDLIVYNLETKQVKKEVEDIDDWL